MNVKEFKKLQACLGQDASGRLVSNKVEANPEVKASGNYSENDAFDLLRMESNAEAPKEKRQHTAHEENMHMRIVSLMATSYPKYAPLLVHNANEFKGTVSQGAKRKALGVRKGFPDFSFFLPTSYYHGLHIELKYGKNKQSEEQKYYEDLLTLQGYQYVVCKSEEEFMNGIAQYIVLGRWGTSGMTAKKCVNYPDMMEEETIR